MRKNPSNQKTKKSPASKLLTLQKIQNYSYSPFDLIGEGYSSSVYKGQSDITGEPVAIKVVDMNRFDEDFYSLLFSGQIQNLNILKDVPNILQMYDHFTTKNKTYLITELCDGELSKQIETNLSEKQVMNYMHQILEGYKHLQKHQIVHRDLKPSNILIKGDTLKIADFGFSVRGQKISDTKYNVGSPIYMSPQSSKKNQYSYQSDIWAIGVVCYELVFNKIPWEATTTSEMIQQMETKDFHKQIMKNGNVHPLLFQFIVKSLEPNLDYRLGPDDLSHFEFQTMNIKQEIGLKQSYDHSLQTKDQNIVTEKMNKNKKKFKHVKIQQQSISPNVITVEISQQSRQNTNFVSRLLLSQLNFCRFLFKLAQNITRHGYPVIFRNYLISTLGSVIMHKTYLVGSFEFDNFLNIQSYEEYKTTKQYKMISKQVQSEFERYGVVFTPETIGPYDIVVVIRTTKSSLIHIHNDIVRKLSSNRMSVDDLKQEIIIFDDITTAFKLFLLVYEGIKEDKEKCYENFALNSNIQNIVEKKPVTTVNLQYLKEVFRRCENLCMNQKVINNV